MLSKAAVAILERRYLKRNEQGDILETPDEMFKRVSCAVAQDDAPEYSDKFYEMMTNLDFLPNSPTLMNAGTPDGQLSACFVLPIEDTMESIFGTLRDAALIHKTGGGTGFSFSRLRPTHSVVKSTGGVASGPISFMNAYNAATETVKQGGKRRGANMGILRVDHPDILDFIHCKDDKSHLTNFNISVAITDVFMKAVLAGGRYDLVDPHTQKVVETAYAKPVWNEIIKAAWASGEPGVFFIDRANAYNSTPGIQEFEATNPCGEQPLLPYESCNLGSINLANMCDSNGINHDKLDYTIKLATRFLDNVIDINCYPLDIIATNTLLTRKIGLGPMGWGDMLLKLHIAYNSNKALRLASTVMERITSVARETSRKLGKERGSFPAKNISMWASEPYMRNATVTTVAPTGTISMIADTSASIEPIYGYAYTKTVMDKDSFLYVNDTLSKTLMDRGLYSKELITELAKTGRVSSLKDIPENLKSIFVCAYDISAESHVMMQAAFQKHTDNAISKTINFPSTATVKDFDEAYKLAYEHGCKGVTAYRDGSRDNQVLKMGTKCDTAVVPRERSPLTQGFTEKYVTGCGNLYVTVNFDDKGICEIFTNTGKAGGCPSQSEASARLATLALRSNVNYESIISQLVGIRCPAAIRNKNSQCLSCPDAISKSLKRAINLLDTDTPLVYEKSIVETTKNICPECGKPVYNAEGCIMCPSCGYSKCN